MSEDKLYPIKLTPVFKDYIWGGTKLITDFNKITDLEKAAESWELSTHPDGESVVATGSYKGLALSDYIKLNGKACVGSCAAGLAFFPILIKLIDAKYNLSVQVHQDGLSKEKWHACWFVLAYMPPPDC